MSDSSLDRAESVFSAALEKPAAERERFVADACGDDAVLHERVLGLLQVHDRAQQAIRAPVDAPHADASIPRGAQGASGHAAATVVAPLDLASSLVGQRIGHYVIRRLVGSGGMGMVYEAEQTEPLRRIVALKIIKWGMDTHQVLARFEAERQALAMMDHPNIARIYDAGATVSGRPYFVMELVVGIPITQYCDQHKLSTRERLDLFTAVCHAVQHAHQKGIIHRDLKASNVLVTLQDDQPVPKVIDFGVAKATNVRLTEQTVFTEFNQLIGTPEYMSPEQAEMDQMGIDTRSDIYSLGVLLYELLTGTTPFDAQTLRAKGFAEIQRIIREVEPPKPSTRLSSMESLPSVAAHRHVEPAQLTRLIRGDLDWIAMKCLEKDRTRRYETANGLAMDILRHLHDEPVMAGPPSTRYRVTKFMRRNRLLVGAVAAALLSLIAGLAASGVALWQAIKARNAEAEQTKIVQRRTDELQKVAEFQAAQFKGIETDRMGIRLRESMINEVIAGLKESGASDGEAVAARAQLEALLARGNTTNVALDVLYEHVFERALKAVDQQFSDQPFVRARLLQSLATTLFDLGMRDKALAPQTTALDIRRKMLGDDDPDTLASIDSMGLLLQAQGKYDAAEEYLSEALERRRRVLGHDHAATLSSLATMATLIRSQGRLADAEPYYRLALEGRRRTLGQDHPETLTLASNFGALLLTLGKLPEAEALYRDALAGRRRTLGDDHPDTWKAFGALATFLRTQGRPIAEDPLYRDALEAAQRVLSNEQANQLPALDGMASLHAIQGNMLEAERLSRRALEMRRRQLGDDHPDTLISVNVLAMQLRRQRKFDEAERYLRENLDRSRRIYGDHHAANQMDLLATVLMDQGRWSDAEPYLRDSLGGRRRTLGDDHPFISLSLERLGIVLRRQDRLAEAEQCCREVLDRRLRLLGEEHPDTLLSINNLAWVLVDQARYAEAESQLDPAIAVAQATLPPQHPQRMALLYTLWSCYEAWHAAEPGKGYDAKAAELRARLDDFEASTRPASPTTAPSQSQPQ